MHSFSQAVSWTGGGEMKITLSADTPTEARNPAISFRFSEYSCTGTCCWGFLSATVKLWMSCIKALMCKTVFINLGQDDSHQLSVPSSEQSLAPKNTVTAAILVSAVFGLLIRRGRIILAHLELYPDSPLFTTSHFLGINLKFRILTVSENTTWTHQHNAMFF